MSTKQRSRAWQYFSEVNEKSVTSCLLCGQKLSVKNKSTCSLIRHLTKKHQDTVLKRKLKKKSTALLKNTVYIIEPTNGTSSSSDLNDVCTDTDYAIKVQSADSECNFNTVPTPYAYSTTTFNIEDMSQLFLSAEHMLQGGYHHAALRRLQEPNTTIEPHNIMYPVFLLEDDDARQEVSSMPNVFRYGINHLIPVLSDLMDKGLKSILIFGIIETLPKDPAGSHADSSENPVMRALPKLREALPDLLLACDVCLCPYTSHGHCGLLTSTGAIDHAASVKRIAEVALAYAMAGAHVVAPSDMMDNRIKAIKDALVAAKLQNQVSVLSYSCKFASSMYGPFRDTMKSSPMAGDRKCYQLPPGSAALAARAAARDVAEGADFLMVKPGLPYLDIVRQTKNQFPNHPLFIYQVSGEYAMISRSGDSKDVQTNLMEILTCMRRAGADCIITYFAPLILSIISGKN